MAENEKTLFGPGGTSEDFKAEKKKTVLDYPKWLSERGVKTFEYECGRGVPKTPDVFKAIGENAREYGLTLSVHAPYFISLSGTDPEKRLNSVSYIRESVNCAELMGAKTVVIHCGSCATISREEAMLLSADTLFHVVSEIDTDVRFGVETMGKINQLGTLNEVIELCKIDTRLYPVVDFGHINARNLGGYFKSADDYLDVFKKIEKELGEDKAKTLHCHFSKIEYTEKGGEKQHLTFDDNIYGPDYEPFCEALYKYGANATVICESAGTQTRDALLMQNEYLKYFGE